MKRWGANRCEEVLEAEAAETGLQDRGMYIGRCPYRRMISTSGSQYDDSTLCDVHAGAVHNPQ